MGFNTNASNYNKNIKRTKVTTHPLHHKRHVKWCATVSAPPSIIYQILSLLTNPVRSKKMISVVRAYEYPLWT